MKETITYLASVLGGCVLGGAAGSIGVFYGCVLMDKLFHEGQAMWVAVGWLFCFVTFPVGVLFGGLAGFFIAKWLCGSGGAA